MEIDLDTKNEYMYRINEVINYIDMNIDKDLSLKELSSIAHFSMYHFHRVFKAIIGENVNEYTRRLRLEKALLLLKNFTDYSITDIGFEVGFNATSNFTAAFKAYYGITPSEFKKYKDTSLLNTNREVKSRVSIEKYGDLGDVRIEKLPNYRVIYVRNIGSYFSVKKAWVRLIKYAVNKKIIKENTLKIGISYDDPLITKENRLRYDACITIDELTNIDESMNINIIQGGYYGIYKFKDKKENLIKAYDFIYSKWFPTSGYLPDDKNCFEIYRDNIDGNFSGENNIDICIPIRKIK